MPIQPEQEVIDNVSAQDRLNIIRARLTILHDEWDEYEDHKGVIEDILNEPLSTFIDPSTE